MESYTSAIKLAEMRKAARGNPYKMAEYNLAKRDRDDLIEKHFDADNPFVASATDDHLAQLATRAESGELADMMRYSLAKDAAAAHEYAMNGVHEKAVTTIANVRGKLSEGQPITGRDMQALESAVRQHSSPGNVALYSQAKRAADAKSAD